MISHELNVVNNIKEIKYSFVGHVARMSSEDAVNQILHSRHLAWWRHQQTLKRRRRAGDSAHPRRFNALGRWETPLETFFGARATPDAHDVVGWMLAAQDREKWRRSCRAFINS